MSESLTDAEIDELLRIMDSNMGTALAEARKISTAMRELKALRKRHTGIEFLFAWMRAPNPMLGGISPGQMIKLGQGHKLIQFIHDAQEDYEAGLPSSAPDVPLLELGE